MSKASKLLSLCHIEEKDTSFTITKNEVVSRSLVSKFSVILTKNDKSVKDLATDKGVASMDSEFDFKYYYSSINDELDQCIARAKTSISLDKHDDLKYGGDLGKYIDDGLISVALRDKSGKKIDSIQDLDWTNSGEVHDVEDPVYKLS